jgi:endonuclease V-like protein UPF0215 family
LTMNRNAFRNMLVVGVEDGSFCKGITRRALLAAVLFRGVKIESVRMAQIAVDGLDATRKLTEILDGWKFVAVLLGGLSFAGFNVIDPSIIYSESGKPVVIVSRTKPDNIAVKRALERHFGDWRVRWRVFAKMGSPSRLVVVKDEPPIYVETLGVDLAWSSNLIRALSVRCRVPEPIRVARLVAQGLS